MTEIPNFDGMTPGRMRRAWLRFMADNDFDAATYSRAEIVRLSIETLILNVNSHGFSIARLNLEQQLAAFEASLKGG